ncbi:RBR-type E3 ubiquitin transferase [Trichonephila clavipes]|nr:RBR-type E3 ubiquitin transferase [Trichonephila clavipes]
MDKITIPDLNGTNYFIWELKMKAVLSLKRLDFLILNEKPEDLTRKDEMDWITKNSDAIAYIKLSLADEKALQFAAEDNAKVLWDKIRTTYIGEGEDRKIDAGNELKNIRMKNGETVADYIARARGISTKCHSLGLDVSPRELANHTVRGLNGTSHFCNDKSLFLDLKPITNMKMSLATEDKSCPVEEIGTLRFRVKYKGSFHEITLTDVLFNLKLRRNLLSGSRLESKGAHFVGTKGKKLMFLIKTG